MITLHITKNLGSKAAMLPGKVCKSLKVQQNSGQFVRLSLYNPEGLPSRKLGLFSTLPYSDMHELLSGKLLQLTYQLYSFTVKSIAAAKDSSAFFFYQPCFSIQNTQSSKIVGPRNLKNCFQPIPANILIPFFFIDDSYDLRGKFSIKFYGDNSILQNVMPKTINQTRP